jgi:hypothetical protein
MGLRRSYRLTVPAALLALLAGCTPGTSARPAASSASPAGRAAPAGQAAPAGCDYAVRRDVLPQWARTGFSDPSPAGIPYVLGSKGAILGVIFGYPLSAPPDAGRNNKILWVARSIAGGEQAPPDASPDLRIDARLAGSTEVAHSTVTGGPGPSSVDLPGAGCWHVTLTWWGHTDTLDLRYNGGS